MVEETLQKLSQMVIRNGKRVNTAKPRIHGPMKK